jgi:hypothetical protein
MRSRVKYALTACFSSLSLLLNFSRVPKETPTLHLILRENRLKTQEIKTPQNPTSNPKDGKRQVFIKLS